MQLKAKVPLFSFSYHPVPEWLDNIATIAKPEPWGNNKKALELYLRANFEIAKGQSRVYEDKTAKRAFWRPGLLLNVTADPLWLVYHKNTRDDPYWQFDKVTTGEAPFGRETAAFTVKYQPPEFNQGWQIHFQQHNIDHILGQKRTRSVSTTCSTRPSGASSMNTSLSEPSMGRSSSSARKRSSFLNGTRATTNS